MNDKINIDGKKKRIFILVSVLVVLIFVAIFVYAKRLNNKVYSSYKTLNKVSLAHLDVAVVSENCKAFSDGIIRYNSYGMSYYSGGKEVWNSSFNIENPVMDMCSGYIAIAQKDSCEVTLIDKSGNQRKIQTSYPIKSVDVSKQGIVAATLDDGDACYIEIYDKDGTSIASGRTVLAGDGYPIDISISNDGTRLVASYLSVSNGSTQSKVVFYNYSSVGQNEVDRIVGGFNQYKSTLVPDVEFINNTTAVAFGDNMFTIYSIEQKPKIAYEEKFEDKIDMVFHSSKYIGIVFKSNSADYSEVLKVYDTSGKKVFTKSLDFKFSDICFAGKNVVMNDSSNCRMYSFSGVERFNYTFDKNIIKLVPLKDDKYSLITGTDVEEIELK